MILTPLQKLPKNVEDLGKLIVAKGLKKLPKVKKNRPIWSHWTLVNFFEARPCSVPNTLHSVHAQYKFFRCL